MTDSFKQNRILIAGTSSGTGKTTITTAILSLLKDKDFNVHGFKCGPDYIDPMYHEKVLGIPSKNLDPFFCDAELLQASFLDGAGEINIIEGCMGLFDGMGVSSDCSSYSVAASLDCPIVLVVDGYGMGYSIVAVIKGFLSMDNNSLIKGVILNRVSEGYFKKLKPVIEGETGVKLIGFLPKQKEILESRHLGLKAPDENSASEKIENIKKIMAGTLDLDELIKLGEEAKGLKCERRLSDYIPESLKGKVIAVAKDEAFSFYYRDNLKALELAGAKLIYFSPIKDECVPKEATGIYLGGGYPELYLKELSENTKMKTSIKEAIEANMPCFAECGGFIYLQKYIEDYEMVGIFDDKAVNKNKLVRFGYVSGRVGDYSLKGHEFHHFDVEKPGNFYAMKKISTSDEYGAGYKYKRLIAGFPHFYFLSDPDFIKEFK